MMKPTHRACAITSSLPVSLSLGASTSAAVTIVGSSWICAMLPDKIEQMIGWGLDKHRTVTHYLINAVLMGLAFGLLVFGILYGLHELAQDRMTNDGGQRFAELLNESSVGFGILTAIGGVIGSVSHCLIDACTRGGVPLLGPFKKKKYWLMPEGMRVRVGEEIITRSGAKRMVMTAGERRWLLGLNTLTIMILFFWISPDISALQGGLPQ